MPEDTTQPAAVAAPQPQYTEEAIHALIDKGWFIPNPRRSKYNTRWWMDDQTGKYNLRQFAALAYGGKKLLFGGKAGGGKSALLLMTACQYLDMPGHSALILRRTWPQLSKPGGLISMAHEWLAPWRECWNEQKRLFKMPSGGTIQFGHMEHEDDKYNFQGDEYQDLLIDEGTQFTETQIEYILTRLRKNAQLDCPLRFRMSANPGGIGHEWVRRWFIGEYSKSTGEFLPKDDMECRFIPSSLSDNPFIDHVSYSAALDEIKDPVLKAQLREGNWDIQASGSILDGAWFEIIGEFPLPQMQVRSWDVAGTVKRRDGRKSDETVGTLWRKDNKVGRFCIADQIAFKGTTEIVENTIESTMEADEAVCKTWTVEEQPPADAGLERKLNRAKRFAGHWYQMLYSNRSKADRVTSVCRDPDERAQSMSVAAQQGLIKLLADKPGRRWNQAFKSECTLFGQKGMPDNRVDSASLGFNAMARMKQTFTIRSGGSDSLVSQSEQSNPLGRAFRAQPAMRYRIR